MGWWPIELFVFGGAAIWGGVMAADQHGVSMVPGMAIGLGGLVTLIVEGIWQGVAFLRGGVFDDHSLLSAIGPIGATGWIGADHLIATAWASPIAYVWGAAMGLGLFVTWIGEQWG